nr:hypothetical protein [Bradyrhizobium cosmicum]
MANAYRVLLTRTRQGMVILVPHGSELDSTRAPNFYDDTFSFLLDCGIGRLSSQSSDRARLDREEHRRSRSYRYERPHQREPRLHCPDPRLHRLSVGGTVLGSD